jgi:hypothetical protein
MLAKSPGDPLVKRDRVQNFNGGVPPWLDVALLAQPSLADSQQEAIGTGPDVQRGGLLAPVQIILLSAATDSEWAGGVTGVPNSDRTNSIFHCPPDTSGLAPSFFFCSPESGPFRAGVLGSASSLSFLSAA